MDKTMINNNLHMAKIRIVNVAISISEQEPENPVAGELMKIASNIEVCKEKLETW